MQEIPFTPKYNSRSCFKFYLVWFLFFLVSQSAFFSKYYIDKQLRTVFISKGMLYLQWKGDLENAVKYMEKAIEIDPKCEFAYETLGSVEAQRLVR